MEPFLFYKKVQDTMYSYYLIWLKQLSLGNPSRARQQFGNVSVLISFPDWPHRLSNFENVVETQFEAVFERRTMLVFAKLRLPRRSLGIPSTAIEPINEEAVWCYFVWISPKRALEDCRKVFHTLRGVGHWGKF